VPTQIVGGQEFIKQISELGRLSDKSVKTILDRLTFHSGQKADVLLTPFLRGEDSVCWSPAGVINYSHERNLLKVMSRGAKTWCQHAATVNGLRSRPLGQAIGSEFAKHGYQFKLDTPIGGDDESTDVDVLLYQTTRPEEVLVVEAKALISPDEINEVSDVTQKVIEAQEQVRRVLHILKATPITEKQRKFKFVNWERVTQFFGVVATVDAEPHSQVDPQEVPVLTYVSLCWRFRPRDFRSPSRFWNACVQRPWQEREITEEEHRHRAITVGDLTYRLPECVARMSEQKT
jgi:hypothetical protein